MNCLLNPIMNGDMKTTTNQAKLAKESRVFRRRIHQPSTIIRPTIRRYETNYWSKVSSKYLHFFNFNNDGDLFSYAGASHYLEVLHYFFDY